MISRKISFSIIIIVFLSFGVSPVLSVPAAPGFHTLEQKDGSKFEAKLWGDERSHGWETKDNYAIVFDETTRNWQYATLDSDGKLSPSKKVVGKDTPPDRTPKNLRPAEKISNVSKSHITQETSASNKIVSPIGNANIPVILINFSDRTPTFTPSNFNTLLFGTGTYSMNDYYQEVSYGTFTVSPGPGGVVGWYRASRGHDYYGTNVPYGDDRWPGTLVREAVIAADNAGFNFAPYDMDGDCYVDVVDIVHQGSGEEASGTTSDIWSHSWDLNSAFYFSRSNGGEITTNDPCQSGGNIKVNKYVIQPETLWGYQQTMGVFAHEYGHALGLPDLYDTDGSSEGIGEWSLMASGSWNFIILAGDRPAHMDPWSKSFLGWIDPTKLDKSAIKQINQVEYNSEVFQLLDNPNGAADWTSGGSGNGEYFLIENRRKTGFDAGLPGEGLLIWHIDESIGNNQNENHKLVDLEEADGLYDLDNKVNRGDATDPWFSKPVGFTESTNPNSKLYNSRPSRVRVTDIGASSPIMTANLKLIDWNSYGSPARDITKEIFGAGDSTVYMHGTSLDPGYEYKIAYYDGGNNKVSTDARRADPDGNLSSNYAFNPTNVSGTWHAQVFNASAIPSPPTSYNPTATNVIVDDGFTVTELALPEFSSIIIPFSVSFIFYIVFRKKIMNGKK